MSKSARAASVTRVSERPKKARGSSEETTSEDVTDTDTPNTPLPKPTSNSKDKEKDKCKGESKSDGQQTLDKHLKPAESTSASEEQIGAALQSLHNRLDKLASQEYIETRLKKIVTEAFLSKKLKEIETEMKAQVKKEIEKVQKQVSALKDKVQTAEEAVDTLLNKVSDMETSVDQLKAESTKKSSDIKQLQDQLKEREIKLKSQAEEINNLEQYTRKNSVRIYGVNDENPRESNTETAGQIVKLVNDKLRLSISTSDIDISHRMGRFKPNANRPIICKFVSRVTKHHVIKARRNLKNTAIVIREDLTLKNAKLLETTSSQEGVQAAWSDEGKIIALLQNNKKVVVDANTDLSRL